MVAALYVDSRGCYAGLPDVELWDVSRDARRYAGPHPVIAHPPCARWGKLWATGPLGRSGKGQDGGCFVAAVAAVDRWGGVLEHPEGSAAWPASRLPRPRRGEWLRTADRPGWVTELDQAAYGHRARKRTWLYYVGRTFPPSMRWEETPGTHLITTSRAVREGRVSRDAVQFVTRRERFLTPPEFAAVLVELARASGGAPESRAWSECAECRTAIETGDRPGPRRRTCGARCRQAASRRRRSARPAVGMTA